MLRSIEIAFVVVCDSDTGALWSLLVLSAFASASGHASPNQMREVVLNRGVPAPRYLIVGRVWQNNISLVKRFISIVINEKNHPRFGQISGMEGKLRILAQAGFRRFH